MYTFINQNGTSNKIYFVEQIDRLVITKWGRIGNKMQSQRKSFRSVYAAELHVNDVINKRLDHGYSMVA